MTVLPSGVLQRMLLLKRRVATQGEPAEMVYHRHHGNSRPQIAANHFNLVTSLT